MDCRVQELCTFMRDRWGHISYALKHHHVINRGAECLMDSLTGFIDPPNEESRFLKMLNIIRLNPSLDEEFGLWEERWGPTVPDSRAKPAQTERSDDYLSRVSLVQTVTTIAGVANVKGMLTNEFLLQGECHASLHEVRTLCAETMRAIRRLMEEIATIAAGPRSDVQSRGAAMRDTALNKPKCYQILYNLSILVSALEKGKTRSPANFSAIHFLKDKVMTKLRPHGAETAAQRSLGMCIDKFRKIAPQVSIAFFRGKKGPRHEDFDSHFGITRMKKLCVLIGTKRECPCAPRLIDMVMGVPGMAGVRFSQFRGLRSLLRIEIWPNDMQMTPEMLRTSFHECGMPHISICEQDMKAFR